MKNPKAPVLEKLERKIDNKINYLEKKLELIQEKESQAEMLNQFFPIKEAYNPKGILKLYKHMKEANHHFSMFYYNLLQVFVMMSGNESLYEDLRENKINERYRKDKSGGF